jgi:heme iron utilization protein
MQKPSTDAPTPSFDPRAAARTLLRTTRWGTLASLQEGAPYASLVTVASDVDGTPLLLISQLAQHTRNLAADSRVSLLLADVGAGDPLSRPRVSIAAKAERMTEQDARAPMPESALARARRRFLARHRQAELYAGFADFSFWRLVPTGAHLVAGFGRIVDLQPGDILADLGGCDDLVAAEASAIAYLNADHADALRLYATRLVGAADGDWRAVGLDPDGVDLDDGVNTARLNFPRRVATPIALRQVLAALAAEARASE